MIVYQDVVIILLIDLLTMISSSDYIAVNNMDKYKQLTINLLTSSNGVLAYKSGE